MIPASKHLKDVVLFLYDESFAVYKRFAVVLGKEGGKQNAGRGSKDDKSDKAESKNECFAIGSTDLVEIPDRKVIAASITDD